MKIRNEIKHLLNGSRITKHTIFEEKQFKDSPLNRIVSITAKDFKQAKCFFCDEMRNNFCWNCEKPHCEKHSYAILTSIIMNSFCIECFKELKKELKVMKNED